MLSRSVLSCGAFWIAGFGHATAEQGKPLKFWNLTATTITELYLSQPSTQAWTANLCLSDPDHTVDPDERLSLKGITGGTYDIRVVDSSKRACLFHGVTLKAQGPYALAVSEEQMKDCKDK
jgi:hypothetical protein